MSDTLKNDKNVPRITDNNKIVSKTVSPVQSEALLSERLLPESLLPWKEEFNRSLHSLFKAVSKYLTFEDLLKIKEACFFGAFAHQYQFRSSGEPYIFHPLSVALILTEIQIDTPSLIGAILHDVIEDTEVSFDDIQEKFGDEVAEIVDGVSKLTKIKFSSKEEAKAENFRKMIIAMTKDIRVIMVKLADRLHNMRTLGSLAEHKKRRIAKDTLEVYTPIASRLGMFILQMELENLCFENIYPWRYQTLEKVMRQNYEMHQEKLEEIKNKLQTKLEQNKIIARLAMRKKSLWSIYKKIRNKGKIEEVFDIFAIRVLVHTVDECYRTLGIVHSLFKPMIGKFKDYIAIPKTNGYQSLHTVVFGTHKLPIELQIRTRDMHVVAEAGAAAHWRYKEQYNYLSHNRDKTSQWLKTMGDIQNSITTSQEFMESIKQDLNQGSIYLFTPKGKIVELPQDSTPIDFAYSIHSDIGNTCVGARVNNVMVDLNVALKNSQSIEIITNKDSFPNPLWLNYVKTAKARSAIRHSLNNLTSIQATDMGKAILEQALNEKKISFDKINPLAFKALIESMSLAKLDDLFCQIGFGKYPALLVVNQLLAINLGQFGETYFHQTDKNNESIQIKNKIFLNDIKNCEIGFGRCCQPLPGDDIIGLISIDKGIIIHKTNCKHFAHYQKNKDRWIDVEWDKKVSGNFPIDLNLIVLDQKGSWASIAACLTELEINIEYIESKPLDNELAQIKTTLRVKNRQHLARTLVRLRHVDVIKKIYLNK